MIRVTDPMREAMAAARIWPTTDGGVAFSVDDFVVICTLPEARAHLLNTMQMASGYERVNDTVGVAVCERRAAGYRTAIMLAKDTPAAQRAASKST